MARSISCLLALLVCVFLVSPLAVAGDEPVAASDDEAAEAIATFKKEYKAKGLKGDDKLMQRDWAMRELSKVQHGDVVAELGKLSKKGDADLATLAVIYLGDMKTFPGDAGKRICQAIRKNKKDPVLVMSGLQSFAELGYLGAGEDLLDLVNSRDYAMKKFAIRTIGAIGDVRLMGDLLKLLGIDMKNEKQQGDKNEGGDQQSGGEEVVEEGYSWDGVDVTYDTGTAGDGDQREAERIGREQMAANRAAAESGRNSGGGGAGPSSGAPGSGGGRGGSSRTLEELAPTILKALHAMTGEKFDKGSEIKAWLREHADELKDRRELLDQMEKQQAKKK